MSIFTKETLRPKSLVLSGGRWVLRLALRDKGDLCQVVFCKNKRRRWTVQNHSGKFAVRTGRDCQTCHSRAWRANNFARYSFAQVKESARKRGIAFSLTFEEFQAIPGLALYLCRKGHKPNDLHIDRKRSSEGYKADNVQISLASANCRKGRKDDPPEDPDNEPF